MSVDIPSLGQTIINVLTGGIGLALAILARMLWLRIDRLLHQTENEHEDAEYPNLREELTSARKTTEDIFEAIGEMRSDNAAARRELEGCREDIRSVSARLDNHINEPCP
jgi:uncharacterized protein (DUF3084 family)